MTGNNIQLDKSGNLKHFLSIEGLDQPLLQTILDHAESFATVGERPVKKVPLLRGKTIANLFFNRILGSMFYSNSFCNRKTE